MHLCLLFGARPSPGRRPWPGGPRQLDRERPWQLHQQVPCIECSSRQQDKTQGLRPRGSVSQEPRSPGQKHPGGAVLAVRSKTLIVYTTAQAHAASARALLGAVRLGARPACGLPLGTTILGTAIKGSKGSMYRLLEITLQKWQLSEQQTHNNKRAAI